MILATKNAVGLFTQFHYADSSPTNDDLGTDFIRVLTHWTVLS
jgi:hypothetical protein